MGTWDIIFVILGSRGTPNGHIEDQMSVFIDFRVLWGTLLGPSLETFLRFSVILNAQMKLGFQVHVFSDPGMETMLKSNGWMC